ncbi:Radical SAM domain protein [Alkaliphilus metalliredigens QYMF]|uniref:Radical SAM domain protein n=1 Tax=Alkaliphilus metalliredigens (strain QYMF) TaxID=293826 RepID=A6TLY7_ALKMQ|nr:tungsten cofactor oxidoreductase radical SAM maturase [Alkaliphilus metalliredigens]ABR47205.1 Radical SAM domain protein [Alkaliphilus metalliredigens QYMF]
MKSLGYKVQQIETNTIKKIYLELTDRCNLDCSICYRKGWGISPKDMELRVLDKFIKDIEGIEGIETIVLGGIGEPTYHGDILDILEKLKGYNLHMTTNGTLLTEDLMKKMIETVHTITVSVDGMQEKFKEIRGIELNLIVESLKNLEKLKQQMNSPYPKVELQFVVSRDNISDIYKVVQLASDLNSSRLIISNLIPQGEDHKDNIVYEIYPTEENKNLLTKIRNYALGKGLNIHIPAMALKTERSCNFIEDMTTFITSTGEVTPCYRLSHDGDEYVFGRDKKVKKYSFGNIMDTPLLDIWNNERYHQFRYTLHNNLYPSCMDCDLVEGCELPRESEDCFGNTISCSDCLWGRKFVVCP